MSRFGAGKGSRPPPGARGASEWAVVARNARPDEQGGSDPALVERIAAWVARTHPDADPEPVATETCMYTTTADEQFILERRGRVVIGSACSGHGFKFAPAVGARLAALARDIL